MHIHILSICGTFMAGIALLAREQGHQVTGSDEHVYPPMSTQLAEAGIEVRQGYHAQHLQPAPDYVVVGNAMSRGNPAVEYVLEQGLRYISGPQWLAEHLLAGSHVLAVTGTHGKTTTASMLAWILEYAGYQPGFLIGGVPRNFTQSARIGAGDFFVVEADEYDSAFFDKRPKFIHYHPKTLVINNIEFDHADIYPNLAAIEQQFSYLLRTVPGKNGRIVHNADDARVAKVLARGCWSPQHSFGLQVADWRATEVAADGGQFMLCRGEQTVGQVQWDLLGQHNVYNALAAIAAAVHAGVEPEQAVAALAAFKSVKRRLEIRGVVNNITLYDDFAHHPTAINLTVAGLRQRVGQSRILAIVELGSYTMRTGVHGQAVVDALQQADQVFILDPEWITPELLSKFQQPVQLLPSVDSIVEKVTASAQPSDHILVMSNKGFGAIHEKLLTHLQPCAID